MLESPLVSPLNQVEADSRIWSFSKYKIYKECNERYAREYIMRLRVPPISQKPFLVGSIAHGVVEEGRLAILEGRHTDLKEYCQDNVIHHFNKHAVKVQDWTPGEPDRVLDDALETVEKYVALILENELLAPDVLCEHTIGTHANPRWLDNGVGLTGFIDWAKITGDSAVVLDAKSSRTMNYIDRDQLTFYALAMEAEFGVKVERVAWMMMRYGKTYWYDVATADKESLKTRLARASAAVAEINLRSSPDHGLCMPCPHNSQCSSYQHWIIDGAVVPLDDEF